MNFRIAAIVFWIFLSVSCSDKKATTINNGIGNSPQEKEVVWKQTSTFRGINVSPAYDNQTLSAMFDVTGVNVIRLSFSSSHLVDKVSPYGFNESAFNDLKRVLDLCRTKGIKAVIDPHTVPGIESNFTMVPGDIFWSDVIYQNRLIALWERIARDFGSYDDVIAGYDLLNEPAVPDEHGDKWNDLVSVLVRTIRNIDKKNTIIIEPTALRRNNRFVDWIQGLVELKLPEDDNLMVSVHFYKPDAFTYQGSDAAHPTGLTYPGTISGAFWNKIRLSQELQPIRNFQKRNSNVPIYIGEFSVARAAGTYGDEYLNDLMDLFEAENWSWSYHQYRGAAIWDAEMPYTDPLSNNSVARTPNASRFKLLKSFYFH